MESKASVHIYLLYNYGVIFQIPKLVCMESDTGFQAKFPNDMSVIVTVWPYSSIQLSG